MIFLDKSVKVIARNHLELNAVISVLSLSEYSTYHANFRGELRILGGGGNR